jgi:hypothetical protein
MPMRPTPREAASFKDLLQARRLATQCRLKRPSRQRCVSGVWARASDLAFYAANTSASVDLVKILSLRFNLRRCDSEIENDPK